MDFKHEIEKSIRMAEEALSTANSLKERYKEAKIFTTKLLRKCEEKGITRVAIGKSHKSVPASVSFSFGPRDSIFQFVPKKTARGHAWPAIWGVVEELDISGGAGNTDQHQADLSNLIDGVYHLKSGKWRKID